jgi:hypothetical protein
MFKELTTVQITHDHDPSAKCLDNDLPSDRNVYIHTLRSDETSWNPRRCILLNKYDIYFLCRTVKQPRAARLYSNTHNTVMSSIRLYDYMSTAFIILRGMIIQRNCTFFVAPAAL